MGVNALERIIRGLTQVAPIAPGGDCLKTLSSRELGLSMAWPRRDLATNILCNILNYGELERYKRGLDDD